MPTVPLAEGVRVTTEMVRTRCLGEQLSLLWPERRVWTLENFDAIWDAIIGHPDLGEGSFMGKLEAQLAGRPTDVYRLVADLYTFYFLYPRGFKTSTKRARILQVVGWISDGPPPDEGILDSAFAEPVGRAGLFYSLRIDLQLGFYAAFFREAIRRQSRLDDAADAQDIADHVACPAVVAAAEGITSQAGVRTARNIALALLFPDTFEPIASDSHKERIVEHWKSHAGEDPDLDNRLANIRKALTPTFGSGFNYYEPAILAQWENDEAPFRPRPKVARPAGIEAVASDTNMAVDEVQALDLLLHERPQLIFYGPPGSGKTFVARRFAQYFARGLEEHIELIQFHQSYGYEEFIRGIRPTTSASGNLSYAVVPGVFFDFCERARGSRDPYVMIIDEINRGNVARIFGELLLALEYREVPVRLAGDRVTDVKWTIPNNVFLVGTMNTADRSLAQLDYALRRRFYFYRLDPMRGGRAPVLERWLSKQGLSIEDQKSVLALFLALNRKVVGLLGDDFQIGHSYFMVDGIETPDGRDRAWKWAIAPLLEEYLYNRRDRQALMDSFAPDKLVEGQSQVSEALDG